MKTNKRKPLYLFFMILAILTFTNAQCDPVNCKDKCCIDLGDGFKCVDDILMCPLQRNRNFNALIASLAVVAFFAIRNDFTLFLLEIKRILLVIPIFLCLLDGFLTRKVLFLNVTLYEIFSYYICCCICMKRRKKSRISH